MGRQPSGWGRAARARRLLLPGRSPLARTCDRLEGALLLALVTLGAAALPAALPAHALTSHQLETAEQEASHGRRQVAAQVLDDPFAPAVEPGAGVAASAEGRSERVTWTGLDGRPRTALLPVDAGSRPGDPVRVWADDAGTAEPATSSHERAVVAWGRVALATAVWWGVLGTVWALLAAAFDRWRDAWWSRQWASTEPRWTSGT